MRTRFQPGRPTLPALVRALPRRAVSRGAGALARLSLPRPLLVGLLALYARWSGADAQEAEKGLAAYGTLLEFFTRRLRPGLRPPPADPLAVACPADGTVHGAGPTEPDSSFRLKGRRHALADLLGSEEEARALAGGTHLVLHLAPGDYHRFHWPFDARAERLLHVPGDLWPVHARALAARPGLLAGNERLVVAGRTEAGGPFALVAVGALNVGSIRLGFARVRTNAGGPAQKRPLPLRACVRARRGDEMGFFELGSALVLLLAPEAGVLWAPEPGTRVRALQAVGRLAGAVGERT